MSLAVLRKSLPDRADASTASAPAENATHRVTATTTPIFLIGRSDIGCVGITSTAEETPRDSLSELTAGQQVQVSASPLESIAVAFVNVDRERGFCGLELSTCTAEPQRDGGEVVVGEIAKVPGDIPVSRGVRAARSRSCAGPSVPEGSPMFRTSRTAASGRVTPFRKPARWTKLLTSRTRPSAFRDTSVNVNRLSSLLSPAKRSANYTSVTHDHLGCNQPKLLKEELPGDGVEERSGKARDAHRKGRKLSRL